MTDAGTAPKPPGVAPETGLPIGTITLLFTDIEGSTRLLRDLGERYAELQERHLTVMRDAIAAAGGTEVVTEGDAFFVAFRSPGRAVACAVDAQRRLAAAAWPHGEPVRVRMGIHTGDVSVAAGSYVGLAVNIASRIAASAHGGQVIVSDVTRGLVAHPLPDGVALRDLGEHRLKDIDHPLRLWQLVVEGLRDDFPPPRTVAGAPRTNLPRERTSFIGREKEQAAVVGLLERSRLVSLIGTGGTGKTRVMLQVARGLVDRYEGGVWLAELGSISDEALIVPEIARALDVVEEPGRSLEATVTDFLRAKHLLLLLDNCEHVVERAALLCESLLSDCAELTILATSREALGVEGESIFQVPSLALPHEIIASGLEHADPDWLADVKSSEAVQLFAERARAVVPSFAVTAANARHVVDICRRLDGIPLALELAASRLATLSAEEIARGLSDRFRLLTGGRRTAVPRQQTLQALVDWSWDLLSEPDRVLLRRLSVFAGGWTLDAAVAVTAVEGEDRLAILNGLSRLVARSLVAVDRSDGDATRYHLLETIRQYARDRLVAAGEAASIRDRHVSYFSRLAAEAADALRGPEMIPWLRRLDRDLDNLRGALDWSFETDAERALTLCVDLKRYWDARARSEEFERLRRGAELAEQLLDRANGEWTRQQKVLLSRALAASAQAQAVWEDASRGVAWAERAVALARDTGDRRALAEALGALLLASVFTGREGLDDLRDQALAAAEQAEDWWLMTMMNSGAAEIQVATGDVERAQQRLATATEVAARSQNPFAIAFAGLNRGIALGLAGRLDEARPWFAEAISRYEEMGDRRFTLISRSDFAHAMRRSGALDEAEAMYRETLHEWVHSGNRGAVANQLECFGYVAQRRGKGRRAVRLLAAADAIREAASASMLPWERLEFDAAVRALREVLAPDEFDDAWREGRRLNLDDAVALALTAE